MFVDAWKREKRTWCTLLWVAWVYLLWVILSKRYLSCNSCIIEIFRHNVCWNNNHNENRSASVILTSKIIRYDNCARNSEYGEIFYNQVCIYCYTRCWMDSKVLFLPVSICNIIDLKCVAKILSIITKQILDVMCLKSFMFVSITQGLNQLVRC